MELSKEYTFKYVLVIFCLGIALEICVSFFLYNNSQNIFNEIFDNTLEKSAEKTKETMEKMNSFIKNLMMFYMTKLKLISKHTFLFNGKYNSKNENIINRNSKIFKNKNLREKIIKAKTDVIKNKGSFKDVFNNGTEKFDYIEYYMNKYGKDIDKNILLNKLSKEHDELNYISYHNYIDEEFNLNDLEEEEIKKMNYLISIFKSIYLERFLSKREKMDIIRFFILTEDELIIYPPEDHSKIYINNSTDFSYCNSDVSYKWFPNFYSCIYYNILVELYYFEGLTFLQDINDFNDLIYTICIPYTYFRGYNLNSILCIDVNFGPLINSLNFEKTKNFDFGFARVIDSNTSDLGYEISIIYSSNRNIIAFRKHSTKATLSTEHFYFYTISINI